MEKRKKRWVIRLFKNMFRKNDDIKKIDILQKPFPIIMDFEQFYS